MQSCLQTFNLDSTHSENYSSVHSLYVGVSNSAGYHPSSCKNKHNYTRCTYLQCMPCMRISMTFEPTGDTCALLLVGVAHAFGKVGHVQQSARKTAKCTVKELEESERGSNTSPNARIWSFLDTGILCFASRCSLLLINLATDFTG